MFNSPYTRTYVRKRITVAARFAYSKFWLCAAVFGLSRLNVFNVNTHPHFWFGREARRWNTFLPSNNIEADYCTANDEAASNWLTDVYRSQFLELYQECTPSLRIGPDGDGGKMVCTQGLPTHACIVYSLGSRLDFSFELAVREQTGCEIFTFDCTVGDIQSSDIPSGVTFFPWCIGDREEKKVISSDFGHTGELGQYYPLAKIMSTLNHKKVDLLKMDIERHEVSVIEALDSKYAPEQIVFETHLHNAYGIWNRPMTYFEWHKMWKKIKLLGYRISSYEPNPGCKCCCEWSIQKASKTRKT